jgi:hypothetical protein
MATRWTTSYTPTSARSNFDGSVGATFVVQRPITISSLGRWKIAGNTGTHALKLVRWEDSTTEVSVSVDLTTGSAGDFVYAAITPITLVPGRRYMLLSEEVNGGDQWYDSSTSAPGGQVATAAVAILDGYVYQVSSAGSYVTAFASTPTPYVPVDFQYTLASSDTADVQLIDRQHFEGPTGGTTTPMDTRTSTILIAVITGYTGSPTLSDSAGNTWTPLTKQTDAAQEGQLFYCLNPVTSASHTFTITDGGTHYGSLIVGAWKGGTFTYGGESSSTGTSPVTASSLSPGSTSLAIQCPVIIGQADRTADLDSGYTFIWETMQVANDHVPAALAWKATSGASTEAPTATAAPTGIRMLSAYFPVTGSAGKGIVANLRRSQHMVIR